MEILIRQQLSDAEKEQNVDALKSTYKLIKSAHDGKSALDSLESFSFDLYVLCAEQAYQMGLPEISHDCLQMYFKGKAPVNQFLGRAYLCQSQLYTPVSTDNLEQFEKFNINLLKTIDFALSDLRYYFLIYNASVIYWKNIRPFLKPGFRYFLIPSLSQIVPALKHPDEEDKDWTAELMIELLECFLDASRIEEATTFSSTAATFIEENVPSRYQNLFSIMVRNKLVDVLDIEDKFESSLNLNIIYKIQTIKGQLDKNQIPEDAATDLNNIFEILKGSRKQVKRNERISLLLELARLSLRLNCINIAMLCLKELKNYKIHDLGREIELDCLECDCEVQTLGPKIETYTKSVVEAQLKVIQKLDLILNRAIRLRDPNIIQVVCTTQWNICLPLLQHNLQHHIRKSLLAIAEVLEKIDSMLILLRCQVHMEIARIEEKADRVETAMEHLEKAINLDNNGQYHEYLKMAFHRLSLNTMLYKSLERLEDQASLMIEQAKKGTANDSVRKKRSLLVNAGLALAPEAFQVVLDSENEAKVPPSKYKDQISHLCAKAEHHARNVEKADGHLKRLGHENEKERIRLWSEIAKTARKQSVWDVCRAACRFCLLYDDNQVVKVSKRKKVVKKKGSATTSDDSEGNILRESPVPIKVFSLERDLLRTLAEVRCINAEATIQLLRTEGVQLNNYPVLPVEANIHTSGYSQHSTRVGKESEWNIYSNWINHLSQYAMENFLRAVRIGEELNEAWIVHNTVAYVLNHNKHLIISKRQRELVDPLQILFNAVKNIGNFGNTTVLVTLCNALARGLILPWIPKMVSKTDEKKINEEGPTKRKKTALKGHDKSFTALITPVDPAGIHDIKAAVEVCEFAMRLPNGSAPDEPVPIAMRQQVIATWVKAKQLLQQQIGRWHGSEEEGNDDGTSPMTKVFIGLEMYSCNGLSLMDFLLPNLSQLVKMALECSWSDSLVQLQTLTRLMHFAHNLHDHELVITCSEKILELGKVPFNTDPKKKGINDYSARQEMLSIATCTQGKSIMENLAGKKHLRVIASKSFVESARYAGEAGNLSIAMVAARHFWNACLPFIGSSADRQHLKAPTEVILKSIIKASEAKSKQEADNMLQLHQWPTVDFQSSSPSDWHFFPGAEEDLTLRTFLYVLLFQAHADKNDWETGLKVLDEAVQILPRTKHRLPIFKHMVMVKARLGRNYIMEIQKFRDETEDYMSDMWHRLASVSFDIVGQLSCYQNAIEVLQKKESELKKVDNILGFAEWLYCKQFPLSEAIKHLEWAINMLLYLRPLQKSPEEEELRNQISIGELRSIKQLEALFRAYTIMAVISGHGSTFYEQYCLMAYAFVIRMWQMSFTTAGLLLKTKVSPAQSTTPKSKDKKDAKKPDPTQGSPTSPPKKDKEKSPKDVKKIRSASKEKVKRKGPIDVLPGNVEEWANYECPDEIREAFKQDSSGCTVNRETILAPTRTLYYLDLLFKELQSMLCTHMTLPLFHLAEIIAHDVVESKSLSNLYHLRLAKICLDLKMYQAASFHEKAVGDVFINEKEQGRFRQEIAFKNENAIQDNQMENKNFDWTTLDIEQRKNLFTAKDKILELNAVTEKELNGLSLPYLWIEKAEVLIQLCLYQPARLLLSEAHQATQEMNDPCGISRCLYLLAVLANLEKNHGQAKALLEKARLIGGNEQFWHDSTFALADAILGDDQEINDKMMQACHFLQKNINVLRPLLKERPNRESELGFIIACFEARKAYIQIDLVKYLINTSGFSNELEIILLESYDKLIHIEKIFLSYGYKDCSADALMACANIHRILGKHTEPAADKQSHYIDAYRLAQCAVSQMEEFFQHINNILPINETRNINTPLMRRLANMKVNFVEIILDIFVLINIEKKNKEARADQIEQIIEDFVRFTPDTSSVEQDWITLGQTVGHNAHAQLTSLPSLCSGCPDIRAKYLYLTGRSLHFLANHIEPFSVDIQWCENAIEVTKINSEKSPPPETETIDEHNEAPSPLLQLTKKQLDDYRKKANELRKRQTWTHEYIFQSTEVLLQCINVAINNNLVDTLAAASLEMVECFGQFDPVSASQFLALYQSCTASLIMKEILLAATLNSSSSQMAAMLHLQHHLQQRGETTGLLRTIEHRLAAISKAWGSLSISSHHFNIMNELPANFHIVILQHSGDRSLLYGAVLEKVKSTNPKEQKEQKEKGGQTKEKGGKEKGGQQKGKFGQPTLQAKIVRSPVNPETFLNILEKVEVFKEEMMDSLLREIEENEFQRKQVSSAKLDTSTEDEEEPDLESMFQTILSDMEEYLKPVLSQLNLSELRRQSPAVSPADSAKTRKGSPGKTKADDSGKTKTKSTPSHGAEDIGECVILLADKDLLELPLEALTIFQDDAISSLSRDFSLQMVYNRIRKDEGDSEGKKSTRPKSEQRRGTKIPALNHILPPNCISIDVHNVKYIVDPYNDGREDELENPANNFRAILEKFEPFTIRWEGIMGDIHFPSYTEWEYILNNCSMLFFSAMARFLSHVALDKLVAMNIPECQLIILSGRVHSKPSLIRLRNQDEGRSSLRLSLEKTTATAIILSLIGVRSVIINQWFTTLEQNTIRLEHLCENFIKVGKTTGQAVRILQRKKTLWDEPPERSPDSPGVEKEDHSKTPSQPSQTPIHPSVVDAILYGLPNTMFT
ncbi:cilia- and flagella-associated protein 46 isoform X2 [Crotalus tigris]|uniref:cilia- and flagella-associated protein 46 isoform X2 n=1 Tax=Crotalus tigris TaxID=88082 RepID=UPI00192F4937|nr:cilia- and flagella-associated protein 46 isoform X2 [Crotalus tigris]